MFLKLKNEKVTIRGRGCADGRNHRNWISKDEKSFPPVSTEVLMLSFMIGKMEVRDVATSDITVAFLQTDYNKGDIHINMEGSMATLPKEIDPTCYKDFIYIDRKQNACMQNTRSLYTET